MVLVAGVFAVCLTWAAFWGTASLEREVEIRALAVENCKVQQRQAPFPSMQQCVESSFRVNYNSIVLGKMPMEATGPTGPTCCGEGIR